MPLKLELKQIVESRQLTALLQTLVAGQRSRDVFEADHDYDQNICLSYIGSTAFKDHPFVFTDSGAYADLATLLSLLDEVVHQATLTKNGLNMIDQ